MARWIKWLGLGGFLAVFLLYSVTFLWCLPYMNERSYCEGDAAIVGYLLVVSTPWAIIFGAMAASKMLRIKLLKEALEREEQAYAALTTTSTEENLPHATRLEEQIVEAIKSEEGSRDSQKR